MADKPENLQEALDEISALEGAIASLLSRLDAKSIDIQSFARETQLLLNAKTVRRPPDTPGQLKLF